jgi:hypothetical protein
MLKKDYESLFAICAFLQQHDVFVSMKQISQWTLKKVHVCRIEIGNEETNLDCLYSLLTTFFETKYGKTLIEKIPNNLLIEK